MSLDSIFTYKLSHKHSKEQAECDSEMIMLFVQGGTYLLKHGRSFTLLHSMQKGTLQLAIQNNALELQVTRRFGENSKVVKASLLGTAKKGSMYLQSEKLLTHSHIKPNCS